MTFIKKEAQAALAKHPEPYALLAYAKFLPGKSIPCLEYHGVKISAINKAWH